MLAGQLDDKGAPGNLGNHHRGVSLLENGGKPSASVKRQAQQGSLDTLAGGLTSQPLCAPRRCRPETPISPETEKEAERRWSCSLEPCGGQSQPGKLGFEKWWSRAPRLCRAVAARMVVRTHSGMSFDSSPIGKSMRLTGSTQGASGLKERPVGAGPFSCFSVPMILHTHEAYYKFTPWDAPV